jgi:hypothetical protein
MRTFTTCCFIAVALILSPKGARAADLAPLSVQAISDNAQQAESAIRRLRDKGPAALEWLVVERQRWGSDKQDASRLAKLDAVIDRVGGQRYCTASHLYWYTDLAKAKQAAANSGKLIVSLRLMGNLTDEFSCANSRFFRTTLYANTTISKLLRDNFILHWQSVRPVPKVTIDFGDGRKLHRTLTGNSIHYVLAPNGKVIDGLPGLYGPQKFKMWLAELLTGANYFTGKQALPEGYSEDSLVKYYHQQQLGKIVRQWQQELAKIKPEVGHKATDQGRGQGAAAKTTAKMSFSAMIDRIPRLERSTNDRVWRRIAVLHAKEATLDNASIALIERENPAAAQEYIERARQASDRGSGQEQENVQDVGQGQGKGEGEKPLLRLIRNLESSIAVDTVRNEYLLHRQIHQWFSEGSATRDVDALDERIYAELFLTPHSDPWLGLAPNGIYSALPNNGVEIKK